MHELSIAMSIVDVVSEEIERLDARLVAVHLMLGPLSGVVKEPLISAYGLACEGSPLERSQLVVHEMPIIAWCPACRIEQRIPSSQYICCPACDTPTPDIRGGRELEIVRLEILNDTSDTHGRSPATSAQTQ